MKQYLELLQDIIDNGIDRDDRTYAMGVGELFYIYNLLTDFNLNIELL
jgi:thymidylate synthase